MATSSTEKPVPSNGTVLADDILYMAFELLSRNTVKEVALVCKRWNKICSPQINRVVDFTFSIGSQQRNADLLHRLRAESKITKEVRVIRIDEWLPPRGVEIERREQLGRTDFEQLSTGPASTQVSGPQSQFLQLVEIIPLFKLKTLVWIGRPNIPKSLLSVISQQPLLDFEIISRDLGGPSPFEPCRLPRTRLRLIRTLLDTKVVNITTLVFCIPVSAENRQLVQLLGSIIRASPRLQNLCLRALLPVDPNKYQRGCPWAVEDGHVVPFPPVQSLQLSDFQMCPESTDDKLAWQQLIQWSEIVKFATTSNLLFCSHNMPKLKVLHLLGSNNLVRMSNPLQTTIREQEERMRKSLLTCPPLIGLVVSNEACLFDRAVWNRHKNTLTSLSIVSPRFDRPPMDAEILAEFRQLPFLTSLAISVIRPLLDYYPHPSRQLPSITETFSSEEPFATIHKSISSLVWVEHFELGVFIMYPPITFQYCRQIWDFLWNALLECGRASFGPTWRPRLRELDLIAASTTLCTVYFNIQSSEGAEDGSCTIKCLMLDHVRRYRQEFAGPGVYGLDALVKKWEDLGLEG
ncbi:hypothetical protein EG329_009899 [Mollisiaceae sp. DMI_Dod_QoI]|nr:hypothetical protein EG329_009899 [Helotiales sp. DMI_Dod_QoI]